MEGRSSNKCLGGGVRKYVREGRGWEGLEEEG